MLNLKSKLKDLKRQPPKWLFKPKGIRYWHTATILSFQDKPQGTYAWSSQKDRDTWAELMQKAASKPQIVKGKVQRERGDGFMEVI